LRTASAFECLLDEPFEPEAPLLELRDLPLDFDFGFVFDLGVDFGVDLDFGLELDFDFVAGFADFEVEGFLVFDFDFGFGFELDFELGVDLVLV